MSRPLRWFDYLTINVFFFALTTLAQTNGLVFPLLIQDYVGEAQKATYLGNLRLWTLMVALLVQALAGMLSDRSTLRWGRRRPFIFVGSLFTMACVAGVGFVAGMQGMSGYWALFAVTILMQIASNSAQGAQQGLIPDLVPAGLRGRFAGVKTLLEVPLPLILVSFVIGRMVSADNLWGALVVAIGVMLVCMLLTMLVPEKPLVEVVSGIDWQPFIRLLLMTAVFTLAILGMGWLVGLVGRLLEGVDAETVLFACMGLVGLAGMVVAVALGVWLSVRVGLGEASLRNPSYTWWVINRLAFLVGTTNLTTFAVYFLQSRLGYAREAAAAPASQLMLLVGVTILLSALPSGFLADRFGSKRMVAVSGLLAAFGTLVVLLSPNLALIFVGGCIIGVATGFFFTSNWALGTKLVPSGEAGRYLGISNLAGAGAGAVGAYIGGPIADYLTAHVPQVVGAGYLLLFAIYGLMFLFSVAVLSLIVEKRS